VGAGALVFLGFLVLGFLGFLFFLGFLVLGFLVLGLMVLGLMVLGFLGFFCRARELSATLPPRSVDSEAADTKMIANKTVAKAKDFMLLLFFDVSVFSME